MNEAMNNSLAENQFSDQWLEAMGFDLTPRRDLIEDCWKRLETGNILDWTNLMEQHSWYFDHLDISSTWSIHQLITFRSPLSGTTPYEFFDGCEDAISAFALFNVTCIMLVLADLGELNELGEL